MLGDAVPLLLALADDREGGPGQKQAGAGGQGHPQLGLHRLHLEKDRLPVDFAGFQGVQMAVVEFPIALDIGVGHPAVEGAAEFHPAAPVFGHQAHFQGGQVAVAHVHQAALPEQGGAPAVVPEPDRPHQHPLLEVELLAEGEGLHPAQVEPFAVLDTKGKGEPVGKVDQILVLDGVPGDLGSQPVVAAGQVGAGIMGLIGPGLGSRPPSAEVTVTQGAQSLAQPFLLRFEPIVDQGPAAHRPSRPSASAASRCRKILTSPGSARA